MRDTHCMCLLDISAHHMSEQCLAHLGILNSISLQIVPDSHRNCSQLLGKTHLELMYCLHLGEPGGHDSAYLVNTKSLPRTISIATSSHYTLVCDISTSPEERRLAFSIARIHSAFSIEESIALFSFTHIRTVLDWVWTLILRKCSCC